MYLAKLDGYPVEEGVGKHSGFDQNFVQPPLYSVGYVGCGKCLDALNLFRLC